MLELWKRAEPLALGFTTVSILPLDEGSSLLKAAATLELSDLPSFVMKNVRSLPEFAGVIARLTYRRCSSDPIASKRFTTTSKLRYKYN